MNLIRRIDRVVREGRLVPGALRRWQAFIDRPLGKVENLKFKQCSPYYPYLYSDECIRDNRETVDDSRHAAIIDRIVAAYQKATSCQERAPQPYQVGTMWRDIYTRAYGPLMVALQRGDRAVLDQLFRDCFRSEITRGLEMGADYKRYSKGGGFDDAYTNQYLRNLHTWLWLFDGSQSLDDLAFPRIGNPFGPVIDGTLIPRCAIRLHYYASRIVALLGAGERPVVAEIGAGFGGVPYHLFKQAGRPLTYIDFDLPETLALASYFLLSAFPDRRVMLFGEGELSADAIGAHDILLMPNFELAKLPDRSVDVFFNSDSLVEMELDTIREYVNHISRTVRGHFLHVNHDGIDYTQNLLFRARASAEFELIAAPRIGTSLRRVQMIPAYFQSPFHYECLYQN